MGLFERNYSRREFFFRISSLIAAFGLSEALLPRLVSALEELPPKPLIWIEGLSCSGCSSSFMNSDYPEAESLLLNDMSLFFHQWFLNNSGQELFQYLYRLINDFRGKYILIIEGAVPGKDEDRYLDLGSAMGKKLTYSELLIQLSGNALASLAVGSCASFGGFSALGPSAAQPAMKNIENTKVINIPGCPAHPDWITGTAIHIFSYGLNEVLSDLDEFNRPKAFFKQYVHDICFRRAAFNEGHFLTDYNNPEQVSKFCLYKKGCKGMVTKSDCPLRLWNNRQNFCLKAGVPCYGCTEPDYPANFIPFDQKEEGVKIPGYFGVKKGSDQAAILLSVTAAAGLGAHLSYKKIKKSKKDKEEEDSGAKN